MRVGLLCALLQALLLVPFATAAQLPGVEASELERLYGPRLTPEARAYQKVGPSVVHVEVYTLRFPVSVEGLAEVAATLEEGLDRLRQDGSKEGEGSGVIIDPRGFVITNGHVAMPEGSDGFDDKYCRLSFAEQFGAGVYWAKVVNVDVESDLALLKIAGDGRFQAVPLAASDDLLVGERVIAIGSARGMSHTVTSGILSGVHRDITVGTQVRGPLGIPRTVTREMRGLLQTDAAINRGNSGGPLLNALGELIGINAATLESADGMGYAIPADRVREILEGRLFSLRGWLGMTTSGATLEVGSVHPRGPAGLAGMQVGDLIYAVGGVPVSDLAAFQREMVLYDPGQTVRVDCLRGGKPRSVEVPIMTFAQRDSFGLLGFESRAVQVPYDNRLWPAVQITEVYPGSGADDLGLKPGDLIVAVHLIGQANDGWRPVASPAELVALVRGPDFDFADLNLWWIVGDHSQSLKGRLEFDDPTLGEAARAPVAEIGTGTGAAIRPGG